MTTNHPPIQSLRALVCFSKTGTIAATAEELNLTRSAVSYQLRQLEDRLGFHLFERNNNMLTLTRQGGAYALEVRKALDTLSAASIRNASAGLHGALTISCTPGFGGGWLSGCIGGFLDLQPDIQIKIKRPKALADVSDPDVDVFISYGDGRWDHMEVTLLKNVSVTPICSPILLNKYSLAQPTDLRKVHLLEVDDHQRDWDRWLAAAGEGSLLASARMRSAEWQFSYFAAIHAQGVALGDVFTCRAALGQGLLVQPFELAIRSPSAYYLVIPPAKADSKPVVSFVSWLRSELARADENAETGLV